YHHPVTELQPASHILERTTPLASPSSMAEIHRDVWIVTLKVRFDRGIVLRLPLVATDEEDSHAPPIFARWQCQFFAMGLLQRLEPRQQRCIMVIRYSVFTDSTEDRFGIADSIAII